MQENQSMKNLMGILIIGFVSLSLFSYQSKKIKSSLESKFYTDSIYSKHLAEYRKHNVYLPKGFNSEKKYPIIYATDGAESIVNSFIKSVLDSLIGNQTIQPIIYVGSHSNNKLADSIDSKTGNGKKVYLQYRNFEYVELYNAEINSPTLADRFENHMLYFKDELIPEVEKKFNQNISQKDRIFYGVSNGAGFGGNLLNKFPNVIGTFICYSTLGSNVERNNWNENSKYPDLYLQYGNQESIIFKMESENLYAKYKESNSFCELKNFNGGHDYKKWNEEFTKTIIKLLKVE